MGPQTTAGSLLVGILGQYLASADTKHLKTGSALRAAGYNLSCVNLLENVSISGPPLNKEAFLKQIKRNVDLIYFAPRRILEKKKINSR